MAVEKKRVIARLKALFPKANLSQQRLDAIADKLAKKPTDDADDDAIDAVINDFNDVLSIEDIAKEDDRVRTLEAAKKKAEEAAKKKSPKASDDEEEEEEDELPADTPEYVKKVFKKLNSVSSELEALKSGKDIDTKKQTAAKVFESSEVLKGLKPEIKERWLSRIDVNSEVPVDEQVSALEDEYTELAQNSADTGSFARSAGGGNPPDKAVDEKVVESIVENLGV